MVADHRSAHPNIPGAPWWAAVLIAVTATTIGFGFDAGSGGKELGGVFAGLYVLGCVAAVLAVRHSGIFTAVIQPPLILFITVPGAYFLFHGAKFTGLKDTLINCGYPLIERFPLMLFTSAAVLLIGMARWYFTMWSSVRTPAAAEPAAATATVTPSRFGGLATKFASVFGAGEAAGDKGVEEKPKRKHGIDRPATAERRARSGRPANAPAPTRSRHARPPLDDIGEWPEERPRRQPARGRAGSSRDLDPLAPRPSEAPRRRPPPPRRQPPESREPYRPRPPRGSRFEPYEPYEPYPPYEPPPLPRRRPPPPEHPGNGDSTHHPVSRVRYRDSDYDR